MTIHATSLRQQLFLTTILAGALVLPAPAPKLRAEETRAAALRHWPAAALKEGTTRLLLTTPTHLIKQLRIERGSSLVESHEGTSDIFFVESGRGVITVGGVMAGARSLPDMPGEIRGTGIGGGSRHDLQPMAMINVPPSTPYQIEATDAPLIVVQLRINVGMHPWSIVQTQQATLPATAAHPRVLVPLNADQGTVVYWPAGDLLRAHQTLASRAASGQPYADPRDLVPVPATRTHAYNFMHRILGANGRPPGVEFHQGNTDIYFVIAGRATLLTQGSIEARERIPNRPGEDRGSAITGGQPFRLEAGDVLNMPPEVAHQSVPDPGGYTYMLIKVNTEHYPWELAETLK